VQEGELEVHTVAVVGTAGVVAWDEGVEDGDAVLVSGLDATEGCDIDEAEDRGVAVARVVEDTPIDTLSQGQ
jgi:hypothetical protein